MEIRMSDIGVCFANKNQNLFFVKEFRVESGESVLIKGPSGKGKSTFLHLLAGLVNPVSGSLFYDSINFIQLNENEKCTFRRQHISFIFQKLNLIDHLTPIENIELGSKTQLGDAEIKKTLDLVGLGGKESERTSSLSLGEQQRVAIARTLVSTSQIVLADEPTSSLDEDNTNSIMALLLKSTKEKTLIAVSHDQRIEKHFNRVIQFEDLTP